jgi:hypothetical protein
MEKVMARRPALIAKKAKKPRVTRNEQYLVNFKYLGDEPKLSDDYTEADYMFALNWYGNMCTVGEAREYLKDYLISVNRHKDISQLNKVSDTWIPTTAAWISRIICRGTKVRADANAFLQNKLAETFARKKEEKVEAPANVVSIQERMRERQSEIIGDIEQLIDSEEQFSLYDWLKAKEIPATYCSAIIMHYSPWLQELIEASENSDEQLKEAYRHLTKKQLKDRIVFMSKLLEDAEKYSNVTKKTRAPRKPRAVSVEKRLKHFRYQKEDNNFKIASINPEKIIGAQELWTFNTKYKVVTVFRAIDRGGLQINRSSITGYDEKTSFSKGTGRQPEKALDFLRNGGKIVLKKMMDGLKAHKPLQVRINENTILMRVS